LKILASKSVLWHKHGQEVTIMRIRLDRLRDPLRQIEELLGEVRDALEGGDADAAKDALDDFLDAENPDADDDDDAEPSRGSRR
jgi:hypothetical protein